MEQLSLIRSVFALLCSCRSYRFLISCCFVREFIYEMIDGSYQLSDHAAYQLCNSYTMGCPPVREDNPRALASGLSYVQVDKHGITILYHLHQCRPCTSRDISCLSW